MSTINNLKYKFNTLSILEKLIAINIALFIIPFFLQSIFFLFKIQENSFISWFHLLPDFKYILYRPWSLITYSFFHGSFSHILWNMVLLYTFAKIYLNLFSERQFLKNYVLGVLAGGIVFLLAYYLFPVFKGSYPPLIGSSAGVMAILIFICTYVPDQEIRLLFFNLKIKYIGLGLIIIDVLQIPYGNAGGRLAHLGGALIGFLYAHQLLKGNDISVFLDRFWNFMSNVFSTNSKIKTVHRSKKTPKKETENVNQDRINEILDKISASGYDSLTQDEKDFLFKAGKDS